MVRTKVGLPRALQHGGSLLSEKTQKTLSREMLSSLSPSWPQATELTLEAPGYLCGKSLCLVQPHAPMECAIAPSGLPG